MMNSHSSDTNTLSTTDLLKFKNAFLDSDDEDTLNIDPISCESIMTCSCGGTFQNIDDVIICSNEHCRKISNSSNEDMTIVKDLIPTTKSISVEQRHQIYKELKLMNKMAEQIDVLPLPDEIINGSVELFGQLKNVRPETRNKKRRQLQGSCIYLICIAYGLMRTKKDIQKLCGLTDRNLTTTIGEIEIEMNKGNITLPSNWDVRESTVNSICIKLQIPEKSIPSITDDVKYVLNIISDNILVSSNFDSKILGAIFIVISYHGYDIDLKYICKISIINSETVFNVINTCTDNMFLFKRFSDRCEEIESILKGDNEFKYISQKDIINYIIEQK